MKPKHFILLSLLLLTTGCVKIQPKEVSGGVFKSTDQGENWTQKVFVEAGKNRDVTIADAEVTEIVFDPNDSQTIYLATSNKGLYKTVNGGEQWSNLGTIDSGVNNFVINPKAVTEMYLTRGNQVLKSTDAGLSWNVVYTESRGVTIVDLAIDVYLPDRVYIILETGELVRSPNKGVSWAVYKKFEQSLAKLLIDPRDTRKMYVFTVEEGFYKSTNLGVDWTYIYDQLGSFDGAREFKDATFDLTRPDSLLYGSRYGLLRSFDGGYSWEAVSLLTPAGEANIITVAQNPFNANELYYTTPQGINKSVDGGISWSNKASPSDRLPKILKVDPTAGNVLYLGTFTPPDDSFSFF